MAKHVLWIFAFLIAFVGARRLENHEWQAIPDIAASVWLMHLRDRKLNADK